MKMTKTRGYISAMAVAALVLTTGMTYTFVMNNNSPVASAYTSAANPQDPATAPDSYEVNVPDANLKAALNDVIAKAMNAERRRLGQPEDVVRTATQAITAKDMKVPTNMYGPLGLDGKRITNIEGLQFLVNATYLSITTNNITDVAPLRDLPKLQRLEISRNQLTNGTLQHLAAMPTLTNLNIARNPGLTDISVITNRKDWRALNLGGLKFDDLTALSGMNQMQYLSIDALNTRSKLDLAPIAALPETISLNLGHQTVGLDEDDVRVVKDLPKLTTLNASGNDIRDLQKLFADGFTKLAGNDRSNVVVDQKHAVINLAKGQREFDNPLRTVDGSVVPIIETANVKNKGDKIELVGLNSKASVRVNWSTQFTQGSLANTRFTGYMTVNYDLADAVEPTITPANPAKIVARKGTAINLGDVTAADDPGGSGLKSLTNNAAAQGLDPANPAKGNYTITYTAEDNAGNRATATREVEITDADALQAKVTATTDASLDGYTTDTVDAVKQKRQAAQDIINQPDATQAQIDQALAELDDAINALEVDTRKLVAAVTNRYNTEPEYIQQDPAVQAALAEANRVLNDPDKTPASVDKAARDLIKALEDAKRAEQDRQAEAAADIAEAQQSGNQSPLYFNTAQAAIDAVKDPVKKAELQTQLDALKQAYGAKLNELRQLLEEAKKPELTDGMTEATKQALQQAIATATAPATDGDVDQAVYDALMSDLRAAIDGLRADTAPLEAAMTLHDGQPDYIKNNPAVAAAFRKAQGTRGMPRPGVKDVRDDAKALEDAINAARQAETTAQQTAADALQSAADKLNAPLAPDEMPVIDMPALEAQVAAVQDPARKAVLQAELDALKAKLAARQQQVDDYKKSEEGKRAEAERKAREEAERKAREAAERDARAKSERLADTGAPLVAPAVGGLGAAVAGLWALLRRKRQ